MESKKQLIEKYSLQQFQTKKNEEYRALGHEIDGCKAAISKLDDQQIEFMEQIEAAQRLSAAANEEAQSARLSDMIWPVPAIIAHLSRLVTLAPGDLIFTGTPAGVGPLVRGQTCTVEITGLAAATITIT